MSVVPMMRRGGPPPRARRAAVGRLLTCVLAASVVNPGCKSAAAAGDDRLAWWREARFGMFVHWGVYAVAAGEWNGRPVPGVGEWIMHTARIPAAEYETLPPRFNPVRFDARTWTKLAREAGMKYLVITSKHHDGFCMFDSKQTAYDIVDATPFRRDVLAELSSACREDGIRLGFYYSILDWHHPDSRGERFPAYVRYLHAQVRELLTNYGDVAVMWFDGEWIDEWTAAHGDELYRLCLELQPRVIVNNRVGKGRSGMGNERTSAGDFGTPEQEIPNRGIPGYDWETCMTMNDTWGYRSADQNWKSPAELTRQLIEVVSKGGNFLLNVGPTAEGLIPQPSVERLKAVGSWLAASGDAIYGCTSSPFAHLPWGRCTTRSGTLYLHVMDWPADGALLVPGLRNEVRRAAPLHAPQTVLPVRAAHDGVVIDVRSMAPHPPVTVLAMEVAGDAVVDIVPIRAGSDGSLTLDADGAELRGMQIRCETIDGRRNIGFWTDRQAQAAWAIELASVASYRVELTLACDDASAGSEFVIQADGGMIRGVVPATGGWRNFITLDAGTIVMDAAGRLNLVIGSGASFNGALMNLRQVRLLPLS
jgi:alpha-L-fucosidase